MAIIYIALAMPVFIGLCCLAVDWGHVQLVKTELQSAADAAARAAVGGMPYGVSTAESWAVQTAANNKADGTAVTLIAATDVEFGKWSTQAKTFTALTGSARGAADAIRITARRTTARSNPVQTAFASFLGAPSVDVTATAIASFNTTGFGVVGLDYIYMTGNSSDSYWSASGAYSPGTAQGRGSIASNGHIYLDGTSSIQGDAFPGVGRTVYGASKVSGSTTPLTGPLYFPNGDPGVYRTQNDNNQVPNSYIIGGNSLRVGSNKTVTLPAGNYYFNNVEIQGTVNFSGPATIYCYGNFTMTGQATTNANLPKNLRIVMVPDSNGTAPGTVSIGSGAALYADIYAPQSAVTLSGQGDIFGSVLGKSVSMTGGSAIHYDASLQANTSIALVR